MDKKYKRRNQGIVAIWLASRGVNANPDNANFGPGAVNDDDGDVNAGTNEMFNSDGNENEDYFGVRPVASINCGYVSKACMRDNIETNYILSDKNDKIKIDKFIC